MTARISTEAWRRAVMRAPVAATTKLVCYTIIEGESGYGVATIAGLARLAALAPQTVRRHVRKAAAAGLIEIERAQPGGEWFFLPPADPRITLEPGTPQWEAWLHHFMQRDDGAADAARNLKRVRAPFVALSPWPPESAEVLESPPDSGMRLVTIPHGTAEHAAWLCHWRRTGQAKKAMHHELGTRHLLEASRWPPVPTATNEGDQAHV